MENLKIDRQLVEHLAKLAKLNPTEDEKQSLEKDLKNMLGLVQKLDDLDMSNLEPMHTPSTEKNHLREDEPTEPLAKKEALSNAPFTDGQYFKVKKVINK